ncbi:hypothetical protein [Cellulomonas palmilytica]|uniref:hypothetical protein n=1 Tax=Cellulomonas palmilytica TaxID=2608402 RepID=UPI001F24E1CC|nr:hypothetical protein [Cellulomonas palmilytica]UJP38631.1 hypothetical protein F1D97_09365 [Cellulomonas palmilytica]
MRSRARAAAVVAAAAGVAALVLGLVLALGACVPGSPDDQTTDVDVARYQQLAADPWLGATELGVGRWVFGTNRQFRGGHAAFTRTMTGSVRAVLDAETAAAARVGWDVVGARCPGEDVVHPWRYAVTVRLARPLPDGSAAFATIGVLADSPLGAAPDPGDPTVVRTVRGSAAVAHHADPAVEVPDALGTGALGSLACLGGAGGTSVGDTAALHVAAGAGS